MFLYVFVLLRLYRAPGSPRCHRVFDQEALVEAAVGEEKRRILEEREEMEKTVDEVREGFEKREVLLKVHHAAYFGKNHVFLVSTCHVSSCCVLG